MRKGIIYKHKTSRDVAIEILDFLKKGRAWVKFYNYNLAKVSEWPLQKCTIGVGEILLGKDEDYEEIDM